MLKKNAVGSAVFLESRCMFLPSVLVLFAVLRGVFSKYFTVYYSIQQYGTVNYQL